MTAALELEKGERMPVAAGELVGGKYSVESILGVGGMAVVCSAIHKDLGQEVALKIMRAARKSQEAVDRFLFEARAAVRLKSIHVAKVLDVGTLESGLPYMVMEKLDGDDLDAMLDKRGVLNVEEAIDFVLQACDAISEAHQENIIHRDLKPSNLFVTRTRKGKPLVKVLDFGISKMTLIDPNADDATKRIHTQETIVLGSPSYMSPEQIRGQKDVDVRTDVWSLGAILYELLTGKEPFGSDDPKKVFARVLEEQPPPIETVRIDLPPGLSDVVMQALSKDREKRFDDVDGFATALARFVQKSDFEAPQWRHAIQVEVDLDSMVLKRAAAAETFVLPERERKKGRKLVFAVTLLVLLGAAGAVFAVKSGRFDRLAAAAPDPVVPASAPASIASATPPPPSSPPVVATADPPPSTATTAPRGRRQVLRGARGIVTAPPEEPTPVAAPPAPAPKPAAATEPSSKYRRTDW